MQSPERDPLAPDPSFNSSSAPAPPVFEPAPAPLSISVGNTAPLSAPAELSPYAAQFQPSPYVMPLNGGVSVADDPSLTRRVPRWRWAMSLLLIGFYPAFVSLLARLLPHRRHKKSEAALPSTPHGLLVYLAIDLAIFGLFWALAWAFSRATKDEFLFRWRGAAWKPVLQGFGYAIGLRLALLVVMMFVIIVVAIGMAAVGGDPMALAHLIQQNQPKTDSLFAKNALSNPLYLLLTVTVLSFVAAGLREELWRTSCLAALRHLFPTGWSDRARWIWSIVLSSMIFGLGHIYQGGLGVILTSIIGAGLGLLTWRHRSIWPSVFAHGFFDATSFLLAAMVASKKIPLPKAWFGW